MKSAWILSLIFGIAFAAELTEDPNSTKETTQCGVVIYSQAVKSIKITNRTTERRQIDAYISVIATCPPDMTATAGGGSCIALKDDGKPRGFVYMVKNNVLGDNQWRVACDSTIDQVAIAEATVFCN